MTPNDTTDPTAWRRWLLEQLGELAPCTPAVIMGRAHRVHGWPNTDWRALAAHGALSAALTDLCTDGAVVVRQEDAGGGITVPVLVLA